ncbi:hypothetical protein C6502_15190 [Candidatus Poribacteria bacterium]|nr:MAG: hypothetical protein C6502_15190 [Candidatus Poribacteria bacterium]
MKDRFLTAGYRYCFISLLTIVIVCGSVSDGHTQNYYPDDLGNTWTLHSTDGIDERVVTIEGPETIGTESLNVISDGTYPISDPASKNPTRLFIKTTPGGVLIFRAIVSVAILGEITIDYSPPQTFLPDPIELGSEWTVSGEATASLLGLTIKIEATSTAKVIAIADVTVPAGTFQDCLRIEQQHQTQLSPALATLPSTTITMWLAPDVGLVQALDSKNVKFELISHNIPIDGPVVAVEPKWKLATTWGALKKW